MRNAIFAAIAAAGIATVASGATLRVSSDKAVYVVGEKITLRVSGDAQGETSMGVYGRLVYSGSASVWPETQTQWLIGANWDAGGISNVPCKVPCGLPRPMTGDIPYSDAFNQVAIDEETSDALSDGDSSITFLPPQTTDLLPSGNPFSTVTLLAIRPGVVVVSWASDLEWFSTTSATAVGTSFTIIAAP